MMEKEFPFEEYPIQEKFLRDWTSQSKIFIGGRQSGKTTTLLCEARRFLRNGFDVAWFSPTGSQSKESTSAYKSYFELDNISNLTSHSYSNIRRGIYPDVLILDDFDLFEKDYLYEFGPTDPLFVRAAADYTVDREEVDDIFDSVYTA